MTTVTYEAQPCEDLDEITDVLTHAFRGDDPVISWMIPHDIPDRERYLSGFMRAWVRFMLDHEGFAFISPRRDAVLVGEPSDPQRIPQQDNDAFLAEVRAVTGPAAERCLRLIELLDAHHPAGLPPHGHVAMVGGRPEVQDLGVSANLILAALRYGHARNWGGYCEASSPRNAALWKAYGMTEIGEEIRLPGTDIALTPMFIHPDDVARHPALQTRPHVAG